MRRVFAYAVICERILNEVDGIPSLIRIADLFQVRTSQGVATEELAVPVSVLVYLRMPVKDDVEHRTQIVLVRPDGEEQPVGDPFVGKISQKSPLAPGGLNLAFQIGVAPRQWGLHIIKVMFDGEEVAATIFTLAKLAEPANAEQPLTESERAPA